MLLHHEIVPAASQDQYASGDRVTFEIDPLKDRAIVPGSVRVEAISIVDGAAPPVAMALNTGPLINNFAGAHALFEDVTVSTDMTELFAPSNRDLYATHR